METGSTFMPRRVQYILSASFLVLATVTWVGGVLLQKQDSYSDTFLEQAKNDVPDWVKFLFDESDYTVWTLPNMNYLVTNSKGDVFILAIIYSSDKKTYWLLEEKSHINGKPEKIFLLTLDQLDKVLKKLPKSK